MNKLSKLELEALNIYITLYLDGVDLNQKNTGLPPNQSLHGATDRLIKKGYLTRKNSNYQLTFV